MCSIKTYFLIFSLFVSTLTFAQNEGSKWYFGQYAALDFMTNPPTTLNNSTMTANSGSASMADGAGNLLFYTDGSTIWNQNHAVMANGTGLYGTGTTHLQPALIIQNSANSSLYYVITINAFSNVSPYGLYYSVVDMSLAAGMGSVTVKNATLIAGVVAEKLAATKHCNGTDYWIMCHDQTGNNFNAFLLTAANINTTAVVSAVGTAYSLSGLGSVYIGQQGQMKFSPNGRKLGVAVSNSSPNVFSSFELFDFDASTGVVSNSLSLLSATTSLYASGCEFSPDNSKFYGTKYTWDSYSHIFQWDLCAGSGTAIAASLSSVAITPTATIRAAMQLAPDGKIYVARFGAQTLGVIQNPNIAGVGCNYVDAGQSLSPKSSSNGLPNFPSSYFYQNPTLTLSPYTYTTNGCQIVSFTAPPIPTISVNCVNGYSMNTQWNFGDITSGSANTSTLSNPQHFYTSTGTYTAQFIMNYSTTCNSGTDTVKQTINITQPCITVNTSSGSCYGAGSATATSNGGGAYTYTWLPTNQTNSVASNLTAGVHTLIVHDVNSNFTYTMGTYTITTPPAITINISSSNPTACVNSSVTLNANASGGVSGFTYTWQGVSANNTYTTTQNTQGTYIYTASVTDANNCTASQTTALTFIPSPTLSALPNQTICPNISTTLSISGADTYTWQPNNTISNSISVSPSVQSTYSITGTNTLTGCISTQTTTIYIKPTPTLAITQASITCGALGFGTVTPIGGIGAFSYTWSPTNQTTQIANNLNTSTYTVTVLDNGTGCTTTATTQYTPLQPLTGQLNYQNLLLCNSINTGTANFSNLTNGSGTENYLWTNGTITLTTNTVNTLSAGQWSVTVTDALTACQINSVFIITQPPALTLNIVASTPTACANASIVLTGTTSGGTGTNYLYTWVNGANTFSQTVSETIAGTFVYTLTSTDENTCTITETHTLDFIQNPTLTVSDVSICPLETATLTASGATNYTWTSPQNTNSFTNTFADNPLTTSVYTVTGEALTCTSQTTASIILKPVPTLTITPTSTVCENHSFNFSAGTGTSYVWSGVSGFASNNANNTILLAQPNQTGLYNVTVTAANSCTASTNFSLTVNPLPVINISPSSPSLCLNTNAATLTANGAADSYSWFPQNSLSNANTATTFASPNTNTTYSLITSLNNCTVMNTMFVSVIPPPSLTISLSSPSMCAQAFNGSPNTITVTANGATTYTLSTPDNISSPPPPNASVQISTVPPYVPTGLSTATLYGSNGVCTLSTTAIFSIIPNPTVTVNNYTPVICAGQNFTYTSYGANSYTWNSSTPNYTTYTSGSIAVTNPSINSVLSVVGNSLGCLSPLVTTSITVNPIPEVEITPSNTYVCLGKSVQLNASGTIGNSYAWSPTESLNQNTGNTVFASPTTQQTYTVIASLNNCTNSAVASVSIRPLPNPNIQLIKNGKCAGDSIVLKGSGGMGYEWIFPNGQTLWGFPELRIKASNESFSGNYTLTVYDIYSCSNSKIQSVTINPLPTGQISTNKFEGCVPLCNNFSFKANSQNSITAISWQMNNRNFSGEKINYCFSTAGTHTIQANVKDQNSCANSFTTQVIVYPQPIADFTYSPKEPVESLDNVIFTNTSKGAEKFEWNFSVINQSSQEKNPEILFENTGTYAVALVVQNENQCLDTAIKSIYVLPDFTIFVPNIFTPNSDNLNETFKPIVRGQKEYRFQIFNRWGAKIFETTDVNQGWDGTYRGEPAKADSYVWKITVVNAKEEKKLQGTVVLER
ncbi:MAG: gliding motility-associated C-terminal domain-containing protein [Bacteroidetes bacterium]|nr:gliding motility-associated C-terminal domain-containing protein [Bacteroidota bacterium]